MIMESAKNINDRLWTLDEVAQFLQVRESQVKFWIREKEFPHIKLGGEYRFDPDDVKAYLDDLKKGYRPDSNESELRYVT